MVIYNNNEWGPEVTLERVEKCENGCCELSDPCYKAILDGIHKRRVEALKLVFTLLFFTSRANHCPPSIAHIQHHL